MIAASVPASYRTRAPYRVWTSFVASTAYGMRQAEICGCSTCIQCSDPERHPVAMTEDFRTAPGTDTPVHRYGLRSDVVVTACGDDAELAHPWGRQRIRDLGVGTVRRMVELAQTQLVLDPRAAEDVRLLQLLQRLPHLATTTLVGGRGMALVTAVPVARTAGLPAGPPWRGGVALAVLSRFAYLRRLPDNGDGVCVLECPLADFRITLHQPAAAAFIAALATPRPPVEAARLAAISPLVGEALALLLQETGFLDNNTAQVDNLDAWDFHDLLFHSRSRLRLHDYPRSCDLQPHRNLPEPGLPRRYQHVEEAAGIDLPVPDWTTVLGPDPKFSQVLEGRRSVRAYSDTPITIQQLGELLYRSARVRKLIPKNPQAANGYAIVHRPYPGGGAVGEIEVHAAVARCDGLDPGVYHYDAAAHRLHSRPSHPDREAAFREVMAGARRATGTATDLQVLLLMTSRLGRLSWKYDQIAYALTLKHVGVLYQTLYLTATAMGLAPCALGSGSIDAAAEALGLDWVSEPVVGEFLIGSRPVDGSPAASGFTDVVPLARAAGQQPGSDGSLSWSSTVTGS